MIKNAKALLVGSDSHGASLGGSVTETTEAQTNAKNTAITRNTGLRPNDKTIAGNSVIVSTNPTRPSNATFAIITCVVVRQYATTSGSSRTIAIREGTTTLTTFEVDRPVQNSSNNNSQGWDIGQFIQSSPPASPSYNLYNDSGSSLSIQHARIIVNYITLNDTHDANLTGSPPTDTHSASRTGANTQTTREDDIIE